MLTQNSSPLAYATVIQAWQDDPRFRDFFIELLASCPFTAFRWETPPVTLATLHQPFECVLIASPGLASTPDRQTFAPYFKPGHTVVNFLNLGKDAVLVVPCPTDATCDYSHLGAFIQQAPKTQQHDLWTLVGNTLAQHLRNRPAHQPVWLSTAGGGIAWLHVRLDDTPKYYHHSPYRTMG